MATPCARAAMNVRCSHRAFEVHHRTVENALRIHSFGQIVDLRKGCGPVRNRQSSLDVQPLEGRCALPHPPPGPGSATGIIKIGTG